MAYGLILTVFTIALAAVFIFASEASWWTKALVGAVLATSFLWRYGLFLQAALGITLCLYFTYIRSR